MSDSPSPALTEHRFPCAACGADYRYDPGADRLICDHCGDVAEIETGGPWQGGIRELDFAAALRDQLPAQEMEETRVTACTSCGAQVELGSDTHATECPFCASPSPHRSDACSITCRRKTPRPLPSRGWRPAAA